MYPRSLGISFLLGCDSKNKNKDTQTPCFAPIVNEVVVLMVLSPHRPCLAAGTFGTLVNDNCDGGVTRCGDSRLNLAGVGHMEGWEYRGHVVAVVCRSCSAARSCDRLLRQHGVLKTRPTTLGDCDRLV